MPDPLLWRAIVALLCIAFAGVLLQLPEGQNLAWLLIGVGGGIVAQTWWRNRTRP
ncbi:MAG TPA: hypothetical protein VFS21_06060 [Roseiflexaceae bacterium]|nr:hypothetical protein [Roseiflexaceae bacterium]